MALRTREALKTLLKHITMERIKRNTLKIPYGIGATKAKADALKDITEECGTGFFTKNYISIEHIVLSLPELKQQYISI